MNDHPGDAIIVSFIGGPCNGQDWAMRPEDVQNTIYIDMQRSTLPSDADFNAPVVVTRRRCKYDRVGKSMFWACDLLYGFKEMP